MDELELIFENATRSAIFTNREVLRPDYIPDQLPHRGNEIRKVAMVMATALQGVRPSNLFIYGLTGTGKTAVAKYVLKRLSAKAERGVKRVKWIYINTRIENTSYRVLAHIAEGLGLKIPFTGLSTSEVYRRIINRLNSDSVILILVLDEIDFMVRKEGDEILYRLSRVNEDLSSSKVTIVGITNDIRFIESLDPRVKSSLGEEELVFPPYNASQLEDILSERAKLAFRPGALGDGVIPLCAALAAREHGDARRALDLLRVAGEVAEREGADVVSEDHVHRAYNELERDRAVEVISTLPLHSKIVLYTIYRSVGDTPPTTGEVYVKYRELCQRMGLEPVTQRRVSDIISELDMLGLVNATIINRGRYGKTRILLPTIQRDVVLSALENDPYISMF